MPWPSPLLLKGDICTNEKKMFSENSFQPFIQEYSKELLEVMSYHYMLT